MLVASDEATSGSVIAKPGANLARKQRREPTRLLFLGAVERDRFLHVPVSGAEPLKASGRSASAP